MALANGHGHVRPNPDGSKARCGGPKICHICALEFARYRADEGRQSGGPVANGHMLILPPAGPVLPQAIELGIKLEEAARETAQVRQALQKVWMEAARYREALQLIRTHGGGICEECEKAGGDPKHTACLGSRRSREVATQVITEFQK